MVASKQKQEENVRICLEQSNTCYRQKNHLSSQVLQDKNPAFYTTQSYSMTGKQGGSTLDVMQNIYLTTGELAHGSARTREHNERQVSSLSSSTISIIKRPKVHAFF
jgi:hypothetical protein